MKKSNVAVVATILAALHLLVFFACVGSGKKKAEEHPAAISLPPPAAPAPTPVSSPKEQVLKPVAPILYTKPVAESSREPIAVPASRAGYLRSDRPSRRTSKVYANLLGNPYQSAIVVDAQTGRILFEDRATAYAYPASITKLMTMLIVLEQIDAGKIGLDDKVAITKEVATIGGSEVFLDSRESGQFTVDQLLQALMIHSANDAARALALHVSGTRSAFVDLMNRRARELGMSSTVYHTEHGLPPSDGSQPDISTAYDVALLSLAALRHKETLGYTGTKLAWLPTSTIRKDKFMLANRNALVGKDPYPGCDGLKTGYHSRGGFSLSATASRNDQRVVAVVLGVADRNSRNDIVRKLLDKGFEALRN